MSINAISHHYIPISRGLAMNKEIVSILYSIIIWAKSYAICC